MGSVPHPNGVWPLHPFLPGRLVQSRCRSGAPTLGLMGFRRFPHTPLIPAFFAGLVVFSTSPSPSASVARARWVAVCSIACTHVAHSRSPMVLAWFYLFPLPFWSWPALLEIAFSIIIIGFVFSSA